MKPAIDRHAAYRSFWRGFWRGMTISTRLFQPARQSMPIKFEPLSWASKSDAEALRGDWERIGQDMWSVIDRAEKKTKANGKGRTDSQQSSIA